jgi:hypothetical protein
MKVRLAIRSKKECIEVAVELFSISHEGGGLSVATPRFDSWTQAVNFDPRSADVVHNVDIGGLIIEFPSEAGPDQSRYWMREANPKAEHDYKMMWP